jgi:ABC-2 type transport system ATP-binding protein/lipopolysaccharide transport system ATP-binding protein
MTTSPAIEFCNVTMRYRLPDRRIPTLKEWAIQRLTAKLRYNDFLALQDVTFTADGGETLGIIGANGAGKSTLLRVAAGILAPSAGEAVVRGRVAPIIELGTGFDPELSGRENIFFNGALLGRSRAEMRRRFDEIVEFSALANFIDMPLRTYSTGMVARLAFSVATTVDADIYLLDEVLSVGDESFGMRCQERIERFRRDGGTILLVSHNLPTVERLCRQALWLHEGRVMARGPAPEVVGQYHAGAFSPSFAGRFEGG